MIQIPVNNKQLIELVQDKTKDGIVVTRKDQNGNVDLRYIIEESDMVMLLNYYQFRKNHYETIY